MFFKYRKHSVWHGCFIFTDPKQNSRPLFFWLFFDTHWSLTRMTLFKSLSFQRSSSSTGEVLKFLVYTFFNFTQLIPGPIEVVLLTVKQTTYQSWCHHSILLHNQRVCPVHKVCTRSVMYPLSLFIIGGEARGTENILMRDWTVKRRDLKRLVYTGLRVNIQ